ncbi:MAG: hypothetical protein PVH19_11360 [Planctomycetia bacterium]|jgi:hypothetical protein
MWRSFFLAVGITAFLIGVQTLGVEKFVLHRRDKPATTETAADGKTTPGPHKEIKVQDHTPFTLMAIGAVVVIYAFDLPKRMQG